MEDRLVRGMVPMSVINYLEQRGDPAQTNEAFSQLAQEWSDYPSNLNRGGWYPMRHTVALYGAVADMKDDPEAKNKELFALGQHVAEEAKTMFLRLLVKFLTPAVFARKFPEFWAKDHNFGTVDIDDSGFSENRLLLKLSGVEGYDYIGPVCSGWIQSAFEAMGQENVEVVETERAAGEFASSSYIFKLTWG